jgi:ABC-2 type transport system permease protein
MLVGQVRYQLRLFWRNPRSAFSSFALPVMLVVFINALHGGERLAGGVTFAQVVTAGVAVFGVVAVCYANLASTLVAARDLGVLKRLQGTPLPPWVHVASRVAVSKLVALAQVVVMVALAAALFGVRPVVHTLAATVLTLVVGGACFSALGLAASTFIPNSSAAQAVLTASYLPVVLASNVFSPLGDRPSWMGALASAFPVQHLAAALQIDFNPLTPGSGVQAAHLAHLAAWTVVGTAVYLRRSRSDEASAGEGWAGPGGRRRDRRGWRFLASGSAG